MKGWYESFILLWGMLAIGGVAIVLQCMASKIQGELLVECKQPAGTKNQWIKNLRNKFEVCYELHIPVQDVGGFLDRYLWEYRYGNIRLHTWESMGIYGAWLVATYFGVCTILALYTGSSLRVYGVYCIYTLVLLCMIFGCDLLLQIHAKQKMIRVYLLDYLENTLKSRYENQYLYPEEQEEYQREYFEEEERKEENHTMSEREKIELIGEVLEEYF